MKDSSNSLTKKIQINIFVIILVSLVISVMVFSIKEQGLFFGF